MEYRVGMIVEHPTELWGPGNVLMVSVAPRCAIRHTVSGAQDFRVRLGCPSAFSRSAIAAKLRRSPPRGFQLGHDHGLFKLCHRSEHLANQRTGRVILPTLRRAPTRSTVRFRHYNFQASAALTWPAGRPERLAAR
jgi:hypothetical protein